MCHNMFNEAAELAKLRNKMSLFMMILQAKLDDSGKYLCWVNNTAGEETIQVTLTVTGAYIPS